MSGRSTCSPLVGQPAKRREESAVLPTLPFFSPLASLPCRGSVHIQIQILSEEGRDRFSSWANARWAPMLDKGTPTDVSACQQPLVRARKFCPLGNFSFLTLVNAQYNALSAHVLQQCQVLQYCALHALIIPPEPYCQLSIVPQRVLRKETSLNGATWTQGPSSYAQTVMTPCNLRHSQCTVPCLIAVIFKPLQL